MGHRAPPWIVAALLAGAGASPTLAQEAPRPQGTPGWSDTTQTNVPPPRDTAAGTPDTATAPAEGPASPLPAPWWRRAREPGQSYNERGVEQRPSPESQEGPGPVAPRVPNQAGGSPTQP